MNCPNCKNEYHCGCKSCRNNPYADKSLVRSMPEGDYDVCGHCGLKMHLDQWLDEEFKQYEASKL